MKKFSVSGFYPIMQSEMVVVPTAPDEHRVRVLAFAFKGCRKCFPDENRRKFREIGGISTFECRFGRGTRIYSSSGKRNFLVHLAISDKAYEGVTR